jgi:alanine racemase
MQSSTMIRRTRVEVDLAATISNAHALRKLTVTDVFAVVKADGDGHGAIAVARALAAARAVAGLGVSLVEDAVTLRDAGVNAPILVMAPVEAGRTGVAIVGLMTHVACADTDDPAPDSMTRELCVFREVDRTVTPAGAPLRVRHAANSSGAWLFPEARLALVRTGIAIYGNGTDVPEIAVGDAAALGRASGGASISVAEYGAWTGLSEYEVTCGMSKRVPRTYVGESS